jgi:undecaprenyl-diphosphatase
MLEHFDQQLLLFFNSINSPFWDKVMFAVSLVLIWVPLYISILLYLGIKYKRKFFIILLFIILAVTLSDQSALLIKNLTQRLRPCHEPELAGLVHIVNNKCGGQFSFVSGHAANAFNVALISLLFIRKRWYSIIIIIWALVVGYSRIYLGVHYPGDFLCGSLLGAFIGWSIYNLYILTDNNYLQYKAFFNPRSRVRD